MRRLDIQVSGGCQCGAVRYHAAAVLDNAHICHCRMCQKAVGNYFAALVGAPREELAWTRGQPAVWHSSQHVRRGFCADCGTPLFYEDVSGGHISLAAGSLDRPQDLPPRAQAGMEGRMPWFGTLADIEDTGATEAAGAEWAAAIKLSNNQHPDHDTDQWPPEARS